MKKIVFPIAVLIICVFSTNINAQVIQKKANKWQLVNGVKLKPGTPKTNLVKLESTKVSPSVNSKNATIPKKKDKAVKPPKSLKYGNKKASNSIKKKDEE